MSAPNAPLYKSIPPVKQKLPTNQLPTNQPSSDIDLTNVRPATSVGDANDKFYARAAAAIYSVSGANLSTLAGNSADYGVAILAKWAYQDYFNVPDGDSHRSDTISSLLRQQAGTTGTHGDYDILLNLYIPLVYKYYNDLPVKVREHIINFLLNVRGPLSSHESETLQTIFVPETENHLFLIETARYLTNQILYRRTYDPQFDNRRNGNGNDPQATAVWILHTLQAVLQNDFVEYNARNYQDFIMMALLNLASYAYDDDVRLAARMVLDYISAKVAVSSNDLRRAPPFRRLNEKEHWGPAIPGGFFLKSPLLKPYSGYPTYEPDPQGAWYAMLAGNTGLLGDHAPGQLGSPGNFALGMVVAGVHEYRIPDPILDLFVNHRRTYQRFHHVHVIRDVERLDPVDELYAGSPSYLITAGGHPTDYCYMGVVLGIKGGLSADLGSAMPTTFMPTSVGAPTDANLTLDHMIQFGSFTDRITDNDPVKHHMGVAPNFACGCLIYLPDEFDPNKNPNDARIVQDGNWIFIDRGSDGTKAGYFLAIYRVDIGNNRKCGFLEAYDTWLHLGMFIPFSFREFQQAVKANNPSVNLQFGSDQVNTYVTCSGQRIAFTISPHSDIVSTTDEPEPAGYRDKFTHGTVLNSQQGSGIIVISNPYQGVQITLDMHDVYHPTRTSESGRVERAGWDIHEEVWVDFNSPGNVPEEGDVFHPLKSLAASQNVVAVGGTIKIMPGTTSERPSIHKRIRLVAPIGGVNIGAR